MSEKNISWREKIPITLLPYNQNGSFNCLRRTGQDVCMLLPFGDGGFLRGCELQLQLPVLFFPTVLVSWLHLQRLLVSMSFVFSFLSVETSLLCHLDHDQGDMN